LAAVDAGKLVQRALSNPDLVSPLQRASAVDVIAAGKASSAMLNAFAASSSVPLRRVLGVGPGVPSLLPAGATWQEAGHPLPTVGSLSGARQALDIAASTHGHELLIVLLSGGGSALMALPADGISLEDKQRTARQLMGQGADIYELNTVRKHLSAIKGGQLAAASHAAVITLAVSDVVGDDLSVIASGPTVPDPSTYAEALAVLDRRGGRGHYPAGVVDRLERGDRGAVPETPKPGDRLRHSHARVIGPQRGAIKAARAAAESHGYHVHVLADPVTGEARVAGAAHIERLMPLLAPGSPRPACVISAGETTVTVTGRGQGGRNQEFTLAMAEPLARHGIQAAASSIGTDGIDGPTDAAGAIVDATTLDRAAAAGLDVQRYFHDNNTYAFFDALGDLVRTGPTDTNVGDLQVVLIA
jgi:hydroxypyruvate reductase